MAYSTSKDNTARSDTRIATASNMTQPHQDPILDPQSPEPKYDASLTADPSSQSSIDPDSSKPTILHLGDSTIHHPDIFAWMSSKFHFVRPAPTDLVRSVFMDHLRKRTWGDFAAIIKPAWASGGAMYPWNDELISLLPASVKVMACAGAGFDTVDVHALAARGIIYCNGAGASTESVTNMALYHLISVFNHAIYSAIAARSLSTAQFKDAHDGVPQLSHNPAGHTLGIVGLGNIGFAIARKAFLALDMRIIYTDIAPKPHLEASIKATYYPTLETLLPHCDAILLATPAGPPLLDAHNLSLLPRGARVVNIARGTLIDEDALADALDSGHISAAGLDVHANEPHVNPRLAAMRNVGLTCHTGGGSVETIKAFEKLCLENVEGVLLRGKEGALTGVNVKKD